MNNRDTHRWKNSWPGNFCLSCGMDDPLESQEALINCTCEYGCEKCLYTGALLNPNLTIQPCSATNLKEIDVES